MEAIQDTPTQDDLRPEYDTQTLRVRKTGPGRSAGTTVVALEPDVAAVFTSAEAVNNALRSLIQSARDNAPEAVTASVL